jgi:hypothetical protein
MVGHNTDVFQCSSEDSNVDPDHRSSGISL